MDYFNKTYHPPGTAPGTLSPSKNISHEQFSVYLIDYTATDYVEVELSAVNECKPYLARDSVTWIHLQGTTQTDAIRNLGNIFGLHTLAMEDVLNKGQRPKAEEYDDSLFVILAMPFMRNGLLAIEQVSLFLGEGYVISFHSGEYDPFDPLRLRLRNKKSRIRQQQADYLLYSILDLVIDQGYPVLEGFGDHIETIEDEVLKLSSKRHTLASIHEIRRELLILRRNLWPQREVVNSLLRGDYALVRESTAVYLRDCYDHTTQIIELLENYREMAGNLIDVYLSSSNHRLSEIMRVLTMIATIFIPLTFVVGLYGMNFSHPDSPWAMPELHMYYGYPVVWVIMIVMVIGMLIYFKRKDWF